MNVLIVGGTGPTGPFVVNGLIERGHKVSILHSGTHEVEFLEPVEHLHGDPNFKETLEETLGNRTFDLAVGMYGRTRYVAEVMKGRVKRFIAVGGTAYETGLPQPIPETAPLRTEPRFFYLMGLTEQTVMEAHEQGHYSATFLRYPMIYGPRQMVPLEWPVIRRVLDGRKRLILPESGLALYTWGYSDNAAHAMLLAIDNPDATAGQIYNVRDETALTVRQRIEVISKYMNHEWEFIDVPCELARPSYSYMVPYHRGPSLPMLEHWVTDITKIKKDLGYRDVVPVEEAIMRTTKWWLEHRPAPGGMEETNLADPFDYANEDRLIAEFREFSQKAKAIPFAELDFGHGYAHPKKSGE